MTLLKTREYIDLVELDQFVTETYDLPALGSSDSFHRQFSEAMDYPGQDTMVTLEMLDDESRDDYSEEYWAVVEVFKKLIADGHLPERDEYSVEVWW